jgi:hypothetical protein
LLERLSDCVFLESDAFVAKRPFSEDQQQDLLAVWDQILVNIGFHKARRVADFIVTVSPPLADLFPLMERKLAELDPTVCPFRLDCQFDESLKRIASRGRGEEQEARERQWLPRDIAWLHGNHAAFTSFTKVDTTDLSDGSVADEILRAIGAQTLR